MSQPTTTPAPFKGAVVHYIGTVTRARGRLFTVTNISTNGVMNLRCPTFGALIAVRPSSVTVCLDLNDHSNCATDTNESHPMTFTVGDCVASNKDPNGFGHITEARTDGDGVARYAVAWSDGSTTHSETDDQLRPMPAAVRIENPDFARTLAVYENVHREGWTAPDADGLRVRDEGRDAALVVLWSSCHTSVETIRSLCAVYGRQDDNCPDRAVAVYVRRHETLATAVLRHRQDATDTIVEVHRYDTLVAAGSYPSPTTT